MTKIDALDWAANHQAAAEHVNGRLWPNGEFTVGLVRPLCGKGAVERCEEIGVADVWDEAGGHETPEYLTLSIPSNSHIEPKASRKRGLNGLTGYGRRMVRSGAYLLQQNYHPQDLAFVTLTVPPLSQDGRKALSGGWSNLTRQLLQWLSRHLVKAGVNPNIVGVTEIQTRRLANTGEGYLHFHLVMPSKAKRWRGHAIRVEQLRTWWTRAVQRVSGEEFSEAARIEMAPVKKNCESYLSKYMSKGGTEQVVEFMNDVGLDNIPPTWWCMTKQMRENVTSRISESRELGLHLLAYCSDAHSHVDMDSLCYAKAIELEIDGRFRTMGWVGRLTPSAMDDLKRRK